MKKTKKNICMQILNFKTLHEPETNKTLFLENTKKLTIQSFVKTF